MYTNDQRLSDYQNLTAAQDLADRHDEMYDAIADNQPITLKCDTGDDIGNASEFWHPDYGLVKIWNPVYRVNRLYGNSYEYQSDIGVVVVRQGEIKIFNEPVKTETITLNLHALSELATIMADAEGVTFDNAALVELLKNDQFRKSFDDRRRLTGSL